MKKVVRNVASACYLVFGLPFLAACSDSEYRSTETSFYRFSECVRDAIGDSQIDEAMRESCLLKHEELSESKTFEGATAAFVEKGILEVRLTNPYEFLVTNVEIAFFTPIEDGGDCSSDISRCSSSFAAGRVWLMPNSTGKARIVLLGNYNFVDPKSKRDWSFKIQSVRILWLD